MINQLALKEFRRNSLLNKRLYWLLWFLDLVMNKRHYTCDVYYMGIRFGFLMRDSYGNKFTYLVRGTTDRIFCLKERCNSVSLAPLIALMNRYDISDWVDYDNIPLLVKREIKRCLGEAKVLLLDDASGVVNKVLVIYANSNNIRTILIQHGIFQQAWLNEYRNSRCEYIFTWGKYFSDLYIQSGHNPSKIYEIGYPTDSITRFSNEKSRDTVCFIGQNFNQYGAVYNNNKNRILGLVRECSLSLGLKFLYKPHPGEVLTNNIPEILTEDEIYLPKRNDEIFSTNYLIFGISSTLLFEASFYKMITVQFYDPSFLADDFSSLGFSYKVSCQNECQQILEKFIRGELTPRDIPKNYIDTSIDSGKVVKSTVAYILNQGVA